MSNVPKLRFKEFSGEWVEKTLSELGFFKNGLNKGKEDFGFGYPFVNLMDVFGKDTIKSGEYDLVNATENELKLFNLLKGDVVFIRSSVKRDGVGETVLVMEDLHKTTYSGFLIRFREISNNVSFLYRKYCFKIVKFRNKLVSMSTTSANTNINQESLNSLKITFPTLPEQEKIAAFLTSVDTRIEQLTRKESLLQQYKKGVMQKIFSQEIRFKADDGTGFPAWQEKRLGEIMESVSTRQYQLKSSDIHTIGKYRVIDQGQNLVAGYSDENKKVYKNGSVIVYGDHTTIVKYIDFDFIVGADGTKLLVSGKSNDLKYLYFNIFFNNIEAEGYKRHFSILKNIKLQIPCLAEQNKIAEFLSSIDNKIEQTNQQLTATKQFKKSLLQQMFV